MNFIGLLFYLLAEQGKLHCSQSPQVRAQLPRGLNRVHAHLFAILYSLHKEGSQISTQVPVK